MSAVRTANLNDIKEQEFDAYERVRRSGQFNMFTEARMAAMAAGLTISRYWDVLDNYSRLEKKFKGNTKTKK